MMFSPRSSLSSFRDYYQNSTDREISQFQRSQKITVGYRNFEMSKVLHRWEWKIREQLYWSLFNAFRRINFQLKQPDLTIVRRIKMNSVLKMIESKSSKGQMQRKTLIFWLNQSISQRSFELEVTKLESSLRFFGQRQELLKKSISFAKIESKAFSRQVKLDREKARYIHKLSKALLCVIFRNRINIRLKSAFQAIRHVQVVAKNINSSNITFFKQKKDRKVYEHKADAKINKLRDFISLHNLLVSKVASRLSYSFRLLRKNYSKRLSRTKKERQRDTPSIMQNVVKHMVFLTSKFCSKSKESQTDNKQSLKQIKLRGLVYLLRSKEREILHRCLFEWRSLARVQNLEIERQIQRLQAIKRQYIQQS